MSEDSNTRLKGNWTGREGQKENKRVCVLVFSEGVYWNNTQIDPHTHLIQVYPITQNARSNTLYKQPAASTGSDARVTPGL